MGQTAMLHNIEATAIENLDEKWGGLMAKKVAGLVAKGAVGYGVAKLTKSPLLGELAPDRARRQPIRRIAAPGNYSRMIFKSARFALPPGTYTIRILPRGGVPAPAKTITVVKGQESFINFRYMP